MSKKTDRQSCRDKQKNRETERMSDSECLRRRIDRVVETNRRTERQKECQIVNV